jgi:hypothetical protein
MSPLPPVPFDDPPKHEHVSLNMVAAPLCRLRFAGQNHASSTATLGLNFRSAVIRSELREFPAIVAAKSPPKYGIALCDSAGSSHPFTPYAGDFGGFGRSMIGLL